MELEQHPIHKKVGFYILTTVNSHTLSIFSKVGGETETDETDSSVLSVLCCNKL